jgi:hypothetical protein
MCTNVAAAGKSVRTAGAVYIGSVSDDPYDIRTRVVVERTPHAYAYLGTDLVPLSAATSAAEYAASTSGAPTRGLNECGLAFTWAYAWEKPENKPPPGGSRRTRRGARSCEAVPRWTRRSYCWANCSATSEPQECSPTATGIAR